MPKWIDKILGRPVRLDRTEEPEEETMLNYSDMTYEELEALKKEKRAEGMAIKAEQIKIAAAMDVKITAKKALDKYAALSSVEKAEIQKIVAEQIRSEEAVGVPGE